MSLSQDGQVTTRQSQRETLRPAYCWLAEDSARPPDGRGISHQDGEPRGQRFEGRQTASSAATGRVPGILIQVLTHGRVAQGPGHSKGPPRARRPPRVHLRAESPRQLCELPVSLLPLVGSWSGGISLFSGLEERKGKESPLSVRPDTSSYTPSSPDLLSLIPA